MLDAANAVLLVVDFQEKLMPAIHEGGEAVEHALRLVEFARELDIPIIWTEQYPKGLGPTIPEIKAVLDGHAPLEKTSFGCLGDAAFQDRLSETGRNQLVIAGVEAHVCVLQTALAALEQGYDVYVARDAVSSSSSYQREAAYERLWRAGAVLVTAQMAMFEMLGEAGTPRFKAVLRLLK